MLEDERSSGGASWAAHTGGGETARGQSYDVVLRRALALYRSERAYRRAKHEPLARELDALALHDDNDNDHESVEDNDDDKDNDTDTDAEMAFPCAISATLFKANYDIQSLLVSLDPLVSVAEEFLRACMENLTLDATQRCTFEAVLQAYLAFFARAPTRTSDRTSRRKRSPLLARLNGRVVAFPSGAAWAAFIANRALWSRLPGAPSDAHTQAYKGTLTHARAQSGGPAFASPVSAYVSAYSSRDDTEEGAKKMERARARARASSRPFPQAFAKVRRTFTRTSPNRVSSSERANSNSNSKSKSNSKFKFKSHWGAPSFVPSPSSTFNEANVGFVLACDVDDFFCVS